MTGLAALSILIVDDSPQMRAITASVLEGVGVRNILEAGDAASGLGVLRSEPVDVVVVDYKMAPLNGTEFVRLVRNSPDSRDPFVPIIMLTGHADRRRIYEARDAGVSEFLVKPVTAKALIGRLEMLILKPRPFVKLDGYFGPDRRRINRPDGAERRRATDQRLTIDID
ncbi:response regulator [Brevundimonas sp.]|uniref:response regulator n=1 Tax=Brevundimonas sp. TaxID=1871086 RepID=UPI002D627F96|nr:response regulator [Brevundimonas sp.]HYC69164.1 response regulator [Brevundimonas sp.]